MQIKVDTGVIDQGANFFRGAAEAVEHAKGEAQKAVSCLDGAWDGTASNAFISRFNSHLREVEEAKRFFDEIYQDLVQAKAKYEEAEQMVNSTVGS